MHASLRLSSIEFAARTREEQRALLREHLALREERVVNDEELEALLDAQLAEIMTRIRLAGRLEEFESYVERRSQRGLPRISWIWAALFLLVALAAFLALTLLR